MTELPTSVDSEQPKRPVGSVSIKIEAVPSAPASPAIDFNEWRLPTGGACGTLADIHWDPATGKVIF
jgi:hypothetical protein